MELLEGIDQGAQYPFREFVEQFSALRPLLIVLYYLGHPLVVLGVLLLAVVIFLGRGQFRPALLLATATLAGLGFAYAGKLAVHRVRPNLYLRTAIIAEPSSNSFPSAHALGATALFASLGALLRRRVKRRWPMILGILFSFLAGVDRLLVGHNFLSDVLVGWAAGAVLAMICADLDKRGEPT